MQFGTVMLLLLILFNLFAALTLLFFRKSDTSTTLAWLLVFAFLPYVGFIFYFFFGSRAKYRLLTRKYALTNDSLDKIPYIEPTPLGRLSEEARRNLDLINVNTSGSGSTYTQQNACELYLTAQDKFAKMFDEIEQATESVNVLYFIIKTHDEVGQQLLSLLCKKARQGVTVRLIYDRLGCLKTRARDFDELKQAGAQVYGYLPSFVQTVLEANYRMHRKMVIIDGRVAYTGGINVGDDYFGKTRISPWRDTSIRIEGPAVHDVQLRFVADWVYIDKQISKRKRLRPIEPDLPMLFPQLKPAGDMGVQIVCSGPDSERSHTRDSYQRMISTADRYIYLQTPYFVPDESLMNTLRLAAHAGIDVRVMIPGLPDKKYAYHVTTSYIVELLHCGIRDYVHRGFLHAKTRSEEQTSEVK